MDNTNVNASKEIPQQTKPSSFQMHQQKRSFVSSNPLPSQVATQSPKLHPLISPFRQSTPRLTFASFIVPNCPLKNQRSSTDIKDRSIPERVIHYIACGRFHDMNSIVKKIVVEGLPVDVLPQLAREKIREAVYEVAEVFLDKLTLLPKYYDKVDRNWPFFTAADRINVNQALSQAEPVVKRPYGPVRAYRRGPLANPKPDYVIVDKFNRTIGCRDKDDNPRQRKRRFPYSPSVMSLLSSEDNSPSDEIPCITLDDDDDEVPDVVDTNLRVPEAVRTADETLHSRFDSCSNSKKSSDIVSVDMLTELTSKSAKKTSEQSNEDNAKEKEPNLEYENNKPLKFDLSPLKKKTLLAEGIRVFAREGNSYFHIFNVSLFDEPVQCSQAKDTPSFFQSVTDTQPSNAVFCRSTAIPYRNERLNDSQESIVHVSPFTISDKLVAVTRDRSFQGFFLTDKNLEYDTMTEQSRPVDVQFFFEPTVSRVHSCKNGTIGVVTTRCEPTATNEPQVRLPRSCPDGSCDGCMFHVIVETSFACPICDNNDFEEIRAECIDGRQKVHWIPSKHCILSGAQAKERTEECASSKSLRLLLILACVLIFLLILIIYVFYKRNQHLQYRYMRIVEGKEPEEMETCGLESEDDDAEEDDASNTRVYFGRRKNDYVVGLSIGYRIG